MSRTEGVLSWLDGQRDAAYSIIRIYIGVALFVRGWMMLADPSSITSLSGAQSFYMWYAYIVAGHLIGGLLLAVGLLTRIAAVGQIPILSGAVFLVHLKQGLMSSGQALELASLVLALLLVFSFFGSGTWSLDRYLADKRATARPSTTSSSSADGRAYPSSAVEPYTGGSGTF